MRYSELYDEYSDLLARETVLRQEMHGIPKGYLVTKKIAGKEYLYLQYTAQGKKKSEYVREEDQTRVRAAVARREPGKEELNTLRREQSRLERAAKILDGNLYRTFVLLKQCAENGCPPDGEAQRCTGHCRQQNKINKQNLSRYQLLAMGEVLVLQHRPDCSKSGHAPCCPGRRRNSC